MDLIVYLSVEDVNVFIRELIRFYRIMHPDNRIVYEEEYDKLDEGLDRDVYLSDISRNIEVVINIYDYFDISYVPEIYGTDVNIDLTFGDADLGKRYLLIAEIVNWIMRTSDTDLAIMTEGGLLNFKRVQGKIYYGRESDFAPSEYIPVKYLEFDREKAFEFTHDDKWVFCSEEHIREMERWRKEQDAQLLRQKI